MLTLNYKVFGNENAPSLIILHGLFGMLDNWQSIGQRLSERFRVYVLDQRNHGKSPWTDDHSYYDMANDLLDFVQQQQITAKFYLLGHSMGGKTAMQFAVEHPHLLQQLIIVDIAPKTYPMGEHTTVFAAFNAMPLHQITDRKQAEQLLQQHNLSTDITQFMLKNLYRTVDNTFAWRCNVATLEIHYKSILDNSLYFYDSSNIPTLFVKGAKSERYIELPDDETVLQHHFPNSTIKVVEGAGHWVHAEQPELFLQLINDFLNPILSQ